MPIGEMHVAGYRGQTEMAIVRDLLGIASIEDFRIVVHVPKGASVEEMKKRIAMESGFDRAPALLDRHLEIRELDVGQEYFHTYPEDPQIPIWDPKRRAFGLLGVAPISEKTFEAFEQHVNGEAHYLALAQEQGMGRRFADEAEARARASHGAGRTPLFAVRARSYLEGGNVIAGTRANGHTYAIVGEDSVFISAMHLEEQGVLSPSLPPDVQLAVTKKIIAEDLGLPEMDVVFIEQPTFHIDMLLEPLGPGVLAAGTHRATEAFLKRVMARKDLRPGQWRILTAMLEENARRKPLIDPILDRVIQILRSKLDLEIIEMPGHMSTGDLATVDPCSSRSSRELNFANAVPGIGPDGRAFYITNGSSTLAVEAEFRKLVAETPKLGISRVYFVGSGKPAANLHSFAAENLDHGAGVDCSEIHFPPRAH